jgi:hypothetical protein
MFRYFKSEEQAEVQWTQDPTQSNVLNLNNVRNDASRYFRNKKKVNLKAIFEELETNSEIKNIWYLYGVINDFKKGYQPRNNIVKDDKVYLVADSHRTLARWSYCFCQLLNVHGVNGVRQNTHSSTTST